MPLPDWVEWYAWRPVLEGLATLHEIETQWCILDLQQAHAILDAKSLAEHRAKERHGP